MYYVSSYDSSTVCTHTHVICTIRNVYTAPCHRSGALLSYCSSIVSLFLLHFTSSTNTNNPNSDPCLRV